MHRAINPLPCMPAQHAYVKPYLRLCNEGKRRRSIIQLTIDDIHHSVCMFVCLFVSMGVHGKPRMYFSVAGFLYRPLWTFQLWPPDARVPTDASRILAVEIGTYGRGIRTGNLA
jgi:hypothetical protein